MRKPSRSPPTRTPLGLVALAAAGTFGVLLWAARTIGRHRDRGRSRERDREREELAAVLHDEISPPLVALGYQLDRARRASGADADRALDAARDAAREAQRRVRAMIGRLLRETDISVAGEEGIDRIAGETGRRVEVVRSLDPEMAETPEAELLLGAAREAIRNAVRHGRAERVDMVLRREGERAVLIVSDDGRGFDPETAGGEGHYGLTLLRRRIESVGGEFSLVSAPGHGTVVTCEIPLVGWGGETPDGSEPGVSRGGR